MKVKHPRLNIVRDVPSGDVERWEKSGWIARRPPKPAEPKPAVLVKK